MLKNILTNIVALVIFFAILSPAYATKYYIDALAGSDSNNGTSPSTPWASAYKVSNSTFAAGDTIAFHCGEEFRPISSNPTGAPTNNGVYWTMKPNAGGGGWVGTSTNPITVTSYGDCESNAPAYISGLQCAGTNTGRCAGQTAVAWTNNSGFIYQTPMTFEPYAVYIDNEVNTWPTLQAATCLTGTCLSVPHGGSVTPAGNLPFWAATTSYTSGNAVMNNNGQWYTAGSTATSGSTMPTCRSGTCSDGTITWTFRGEAQAALLAMQPGSWFWDGTNLYVWMPDGSSPQAHVVEVSEAYNTIWFSANSTELNNLVFDHIGIRGGCNGMLYNDLSNSAQPLGQVFKNNYVTETGTGQVDVGQFCNAVTYGPTNGTGTPAPIFSNNRIYYTGGHGALTINQCGNGTQILGNNISHDNHGGIDMPTGGGCSSKSNIIIRNNKVHDLQQALFSHTGPVGSSSGAIYCENCTSTTIADNDIWSIEDPVGATSSSDCSAVWLFGGSNNSVLDNNVDNTYQGFVETNSGTSGLKISGNTWNLTPNPNATSYVYSFADTVSPVSSINNNYVGTSAAFNAFYNGSTQSLSAWQALGFDAELLDVPPRAFQDMLYLEESNKHEKVTLPVAAITNLEGLLLPGVPALNTDQMYGWNGSQFVLQNYYTSAPYDVDFSFAGTVVANLTIPKVMTRTVNFPTDFCQSGSCTFPDAQSQAACVANPNETDDYIVNCCTLSSGTSSCTEIGDVSITTTCTPTFETVSHAVQACSPGQVVEVVAPATVSGSGIAISLGSHTP